MTTQDGTPAPGRGLALAVVVLVVIAALVLFVALGGRRRACIAYVARQCGSATTHDLPGDTGRDPRLDSGRRRA